MGTPMERILRTRQDEDKDPDLPVSLGFSKALDEMLLQHGEFPAPPLLESSLRYCAVQCTAWQIMISCMVWCYSRTSSFPFPFPHRYRNTSLDTLLDFRPHTWQLASHARTATVATTAAATTTHDHRLGFKVCTVERMDGGREVILCKIWQLNYLELLFKKLQFFFCSMLKR